MMKAMKKTYIPPKAEIIVLDTSELMVQTSNVTVGGYDDFSAPQSRRSSGWDDYEK